MTPPSSHHSAAGDNNMTLGSYWKSIARQQQLALEEHQLRRQQQLEKYQNMSSSSSLRARPRPEGSPTESTSTREYLQVTGASPGSQTGSNNSNSSFQQYRQQQRVRKHPWRTDVSGTSKRKSRRNKQAWKKFVATGRDGSSSSTRSTSERPWDEPADVTTIQEVDEEEYENEEEEDEDDGDDATTGGQSQRSRNSRSSRTSKGSSRLSFRSGANNVEEGKEEEDENKVDDGAASRVVSEESGEDEENKDALLPGGTGNRRRLNSKDSSDDGNQSVELSLGDDQISLGEIDDDNDNALPEEKAAEDDKDEEAASPASAAESESHVVTKDEKEEASEPTTTTLHSDHVSHQVDVEESAAAAAAAAAVVNQLFDVVNTDKPDDSPMTGFQHDLDQRVNSIDRGCQGEVESMGRGTGEELSRDTATLGSSSSTHSRKKATPLPKEDSNNKKKTQDELLQEEIQQTVNQLYTGNHHEVEAYGTGRGKTDSQLVADRDVVMRSHLVSALKERLERMYTDHIVELEAVDDGSGAYIVTLHNKPEAATAAPVEVAAQSTPSQEQLDNAVATVAAQTGASVTPEKEEGTPLQTEGGHNEVYGGFGDYEHSDDDGDDDRSVGTVQSIATIQSMIISAAKNTRSGRQQQQYYDDDDDDYTEYTIESSMIPPSRVGNFQLPPHLQPPSMRMMDQQQQQADSDDDDQWDEYTIQSTRSQQIASLKRFSNMPTPTKDMPTANQQQPQKDDSDDDDQWDEYTIQSTRSQQIASLKRFSNLATPTKNITPDKSQSNVPQPVQQPQQVHHPEQQVEDGEEEWEEYSVGTTRSQQIAQLKAFSKMPMVPSPTRQPQPGPPPPSGQKEVEEEEWDEYTIQSTRSQQIAQLKAFATFPAVNPRLQQSQSPQQVQHKPEPQDEDWEEYTVQTTRSQQIAQLRSSLPPTMTKQAAPTANTQHRPPAVTPRADNDHWDEFTIDTVADALLALPQTLRTLQQQQKQQSAAPVRQTLDTYIINTHAPDVSQPAPKNFDSEDYYGDDYDDDDNWDDFTVETVADAFLSLPRTVQLEFLRNTPIENCVPAEYDSEEEDGPPGDMNRVDDHRQTEPSEVESNVVDSPADPPSGKPNVKLNVQVDGSSDGSNKKDGPSSICKPLNTPATASTSSTKTEESETWHDTQMWHDPRPSNSFGASSFGAETTYSDAQSTVSASSSTTRQHRRSLPDMLQHDIFSDDTAVVESALEGLAAKADGDKEFGARIVQSGGLLKIVRVMEGNLEHANIQVLACIALQKIATDSEENQLAICEVGGVEAVVGSMERHMTTNVGVVEAACAALLVMTSNCTTNKMPIEVSVVDVIVKSMTTHSRHALIQETAFRTLANLCLEDKQKLVALSQVGGFVVMSAALAQHWDHPTVKNEAIQTLSLLFGRLAEHQTQ